MMSGESNFLRLVEPFSKKNGGSTKGGQIGKVPSARFLRGFRDV